MPKSDSEFEVLSREVERLVDAEREAKKENRTLEKRVEALERAVQEINPGLNLIAPVRAWDRAPTVVHVSSGVGWAEAIGLRIDGA